MEKKNWPLLASLSEVIFIEEQWSILFQQQKNDECGLYLTREKKINELKR